MKEKANTMVRQMNKEKKKTAVRQWVSLAKPRTSLQLFFFSSVADGAVPVSAPSSPLFSGSPSVALPVVSIVSSMHYRPTDLLNGKTVNIMMVLNDNTLFYLLHSEYS